MEEILKNTTSIIGILGIVILCTRSTNNFFAKVIKEKLYIVKKDNKLSTTLIKTIIFSIGVCEGIYIFTDKTSISKGIDVIKYTLKGSNIVDLIFNTSAYFIIIIWIIIVFSFKKTYFKFVEKITTGKMKSEGNLNVILLYICSILEYITIGGNIYLINLYIEKERYELINYSIIIILIGIFLSVLSSGLKTILIDIKRNDTYVFKRGNKRIKINYYLEIDDYYFVCNNRLEHYIKKSEVTDILVIRENKKYLYDLISFL